MTAADVRRHIMTGSLLLHPQNVMQVDATDSSPQAVSFHYIIYSESYHLVKYF